MGDKSPKSTQKQTAQKQARAAATKQKGRAIVAAKQAAKPKKEKTGAASFVDAFGRLRIIRIAGYILPEN